MWLRPRIEPPPTFPIIRLTDLDICPCNLCYGAVSDQMWCGVGLLRLQFHFILLDTLLLLGHHRFFLNITHVGFMSTK